MRKSDLIIESLNEAGIRDIKSGREFFSIDDANELNDKVFDDLNRLAEKFEDSYRKKYDYFYWDVYNIDTTSTFRIELIIVMPEEASKEITKSFARNFFKSCNPKGCELMFDAGVKSISDALYSSEKEYFKDKNSGEYVKRMVIRVRVTINLS